MEEYDVCAACRPYACHWDCGCLCHRDVKVSAEFAYGPEQATDVNDPCDCGEE